MIAEILLHGYGNVHAVDLDAHLAVVAFERSPWNIHHICIWNLEKNSALRFITAPDVKTLCINAAEGGLLASSTRSEAHAPVLQVGMSGIPSLRRHVIHKLSILGHISERRKKIYV